MSVKYRFTADMRVIENGNKVIILSRDGGAWLKISKQCYDVLNLGIQHGLTIEKLIESLADDEDRDYFRDLFEKLKEMQVVSNNEHSEQVNMNRIKKIKQLYFALTHRCNLKCIHCCIDAGKVSDDEYLTTEQVLSAIDKVIVLDPLSIVFTGGEPMIRKDFIQILEYTARRYKGKITLSTNGTLINEENVKILAQLCNQIDISLDGVDEDSCTIIRGPGVYDRVMKSIKLLKDIDFKKINLSMTIGEKTAHLEDRFNALNASLGTTPIIRVFSPIGRGSVNDLNLMNKKSNLTFIPEKFLKGILNKPLRGCACGAGHKELFINSDGYVYPCPNLTEEKYKICHIKDMDDFNYDCTQLKPYKYLAEIEPDSLSRCKDCTVNMFCWTCLEELSRLKNYELDFNERCSIVKPILYDKVWNG